MASVFLGLGIAATIGHVACDLLKFREHIKHPRDWFSVLSVGFLLGHVILTGELATWVRSI